MTDAKRAAYEAFVRAKVRMAPDTGFDVDPSEIHSRLKPHQAVMVRWLVRGGRRACFAAFGLGKSTIQIETLRLVLKRTGGRGLIVAPLGVRQEFMRDAAALGVEVRFIRSIEEVGAEGLYVTNYETVRDGKLDPAHFQAATLDEASCLRGFGGTKTFREFMRLFEAVPFRFVATATPSPNAFIELLAYSAFLGVMDVGEAKTRFFRRNSEKADELTLHPHKEREFWLWVASWGLFVSKPSDLGFSDEGYALPPMTVTWHEVSVDHSAAAADKFGQTQMFREATKSVVSAARERRDTLQDRIAKAAEIVASDPEAHWLIWHDLEDERRAIEATIPGVVSVYGAQDLEEREAAVAGFSDGTITRLAAKPVLAGSGCNFQRHCHKAVFVGVGFKFNDFIQACHRVQRFLQTRPVEIHIVHADSERPIVRTLRDKWRRHEEQAAVMSDIVKEHGLSDADVTAALTRAFGVKERVEVKGERFTCVHNDCVLETQSMASDSVDLIVTSVPFATQYEYTPSYNDFGHTDDNAHFWAQMDFLIPELFRVLKPGRSAAIHVKDRIIPGGMTGLGFQTVYPFADDCRRAFIRHGFAYLGEKTNLTDVVRENNQTYRLGWTEQCKDGSRMGAGLPEKVLLFRRPPSDSSNGYADTPVVKDKAAYTRARWQLDAHHLSRSSGDRLLAPEELAHLDSGVVYRLWKAFNLSRVYDFEHHLKIGEQLEAVGRLPPDFMLLPPHSWHEDVWTDVMQARSLNTSQSQKGAEMHLCPLPFDIVDRLITQFSMPDEVVLDPFGGLMTVPYRALKLGRRGYGIELNPNYFAAGVQYCEAMAREIAMPSLLDLLDDKAAA